MIMIQIDNHNPMGMAGAKPNVLLSTDDVGYNYRPELNIKVPTFIWTFSFTEKETLTSDLIFRYWY